MKRFIQGEHRDQGALLPESLDDYVSDTNPVRIVDVFVDELDLVNLGFDGAVPAVTGRPAYHPEVLLKIYIYGYLNRIQSSRRLEREAQRNVELMWLTGRLMPDFKTIANFRKDNSKAIRGVCRQFVVLCQQLGLFGENLVAIDGSKFKAVNNRDRNFTSAKLKRRMEEIESSISHYLTALDAVDQQESTASEPRAVRLEEKIAKLKKQMKELQAIETESAERGHSRQAAISQKQPSIFPAIQTAPPHLKQQIGAFNPATHGLSNLGNSGPSGSLSSTNRTDSPPCSITTPFPSTATNFTPGPTFSPCKKLRGGPSFKLSIATAPRLPAITPLTLISTGAV